MKGVMSSYNDYDGVPVQGSRHWLTDILRKDMGFDGYVVSDSDAVEYLHSKHHVAANMKESVRLSVEAGLNVRCTFRSPDSYVLPLRELVQEGTIPMEMIDERVRDVLKVKFLVGLFDDPYQRDYKAADEEIDCEANNVYALQASREAMVLLKNANNTLPLDRSKVKKIAVVGPNATAEKFALLHYGPQANEVTNVVEGIILREHQLYYMQELKAPTGYRLDDTKYWFCFCDEKTDSCDTCSAVLDGKETAFRIPFETVGVVNAANELMDYNLPSTGGMGSYPIVMLSVTFIVTPLTYGYILRRKKDRRGIG